MSASQPYKPVKVDLVVQDYMDSLLADLFPDVESAAVSEKSSTAPAEPKVLPKPAAPAADSKPSPLPEVTALPVQAKPPVSAKVGEPARATIEHEVPTPAPPAAIASSVSQVKTELETATVDAAEAAELKYPNAPPWAQQEFDVLLFDVCGLKLAVSMEALGRIIKVEHELNQLIGRPGWFMGAYTEAEQSLYVVDTAKFIMPEKGFDMSEMGFDFIIQLQRSHWTLACKEVYSTVRIQPDQVKWRSTKGKRPWLAGTVIEHMCALIHVDSLVALLESENP